MPSQCLETTPSGDQVATLQCIPFLIKNLINYGFILGGTVALIFIILSGIRLTQSSGDAKQAEEARNTLKFAIIGLVIVLLSAAIVNLIATITNVHCITLLGFDTCK